MMDGYSVTDAASVLGVPEGRIWELLARGVLSGTPHGDSMRVFLKSQPGPIATASQHDEPPRTNGNGGSHPPAVEASAFRELLTEFRNLTERYGQALLALGESRGEVAALRTRVDLLEARIDVRVPASVDASAIAWEPAPTAEPAEPLPTVEPEPPGPAPIRRSASRRARTARAATAEFADALARADDPTPDIGELPTPHEHEQAAAPAEASEVEAAAEALEVEEAAAPEEAAAAQPTSSDVAIEIVDTTAQPATDVPAEEPEAPEPVAAVEAPAEPEAAVETPPAPEPATLPDPQPPTYSADVIEPDWFADGDFAWLDAAELEARSEATPRPAPTVEETAVAEPMAVDEPAPIPEAEPIAAPAQQPAPPPVPVEAQVEPIAEPVAVAPPSEPEQPRTVAVPIEPAHSVELPPVPEPAMPAAEGEVVWPELPREAVTETQPWPTADVAPVAPPPNPAAAEPEPEPPPLLNMTEAELMQLAREEGWDAAEVATIRAMIRQPSSPAARLPGAAELDDAMSALKAVPVQAPADQPLRQWAKPPGGSSAPSYDDWSFEVEAPPPAPVTSAPAYGIPRRPPGDPTWLRTRQGPAATAYRRLRRLFTG